MLVADQLPKICLSCDDACVDEFMFSNGRVCGMTEISISESKKNNNLRKRWLKMKY